LSPPLLYIPLTDLRFFFGGTSSLILFLVVRHIDPSPI
jgi:hypothetical protein